MYVARVFLKLFNKMGLFKGIGQRVKERQKQRQEFKLEKERIVQEANMAAYANGVQPAPTAAASFAGSLNNLVDKAGELAGNFMTAKTGGISKFSGSQTKSLENNPPQNNGGKKDNTMMMVLAAGVLLFAFGKK